MKGGAKLNITPYAISKKLKKPAQVVYKKIEVLLKKPPCENIEEHIKKVNDKWIIDEIGEELIISSFKDDQPNEQIYEQINEQKNEQLLSYMNIEITMLREQLKTANEELIKEREFSRSQADKITDLADRLARLNENQQVLLLSEQTKNAPLLSESTTDAEAGGSSELSDIQNNKKSLWQRLFKQKK